MSAYLRHPKAEGFRCVDCGLLHEGKALVRVEKITRRYSVYHIEVDPLCLPCWRIYMKEDGL